MARGTLFLVVGPSGAGKDTLIGAARAVLAGNGNVEFARRVITRPANGGAEPHIPAEPTEFDLKRRAGGFMLHWRVHDTDYGIPAAYGAKLAAGRSVVANVSRTVVVAAAARFAPVHVVEITAPPDMLARRLAQRARDGADGVAMRLSRAVSLPSGVPLSRVENTGTAEEGSARLVAILRG